MLKVVVSGCGRYCLRNEDNEFKTLCSLCAVCEDFCNKQKYIPEHIREKVLYITDFETDYFNRNKGYATYLLKEVIELLKDEYDLSSIVEVTPAVNFENISTVVVLNRKAEE